MSRIRAEVTTLTVCGMSMIAVLRRVAEENDETP
jgi:hypothetical protein